MEVEYREAADRSATSYADTGRCGSRHWCVELREPGGGNKSKASGEWSGLVTRGGPRYKSRMSTDEPSASQPLPGAPLYFLELAVRNVRCFGPRQVLDLRDREGRPARWTVILGENGVGKTTLLQCLFGMKPTTQPRAPGASVGTVTNSGAWRDAELLRDGASEPFRVDAEVVAGDVLGTAAGTAVQMQFFAEWSPVRQRGTQYGELELDMFCCAYGASRQPGRSALAPLRSTSTGASLFADNTELINVEELLLQTDYARKLGTPKAAERFEQLQTAVLRLLPRVHGLRIRSPERMPAKPVVELQTPYGWVRPHQLSLGYKAMLGWALDLASRMFERYPDSPDPLAEPAVVLVDEIDLHLHPQWQRDILQFLGERFSRTQFIVTAHSPLIVQAALGANLAVLRTAPEGDHVDIENDPEVVRGWRVDQLLTSDLFGLPSARPPEYAALLERRGQLVERPVRTAQEETELRAIDAELEAMPAGETAAERDAWDALLELTADVRKRRTGG